MKLTRVRLVPALPQGETRHSCRQGQLAWRTFGPKGQVSVRTAANCLALHLSLEDSRRSAQSGSCFGPGKIGSQIQCYQKLQFNIHLKLTIYCVSGLSP